jgi:uncharacterized membrane protein
MEICILKFAGSRNAEDALAEVIDAAADRNPWLHDIGVVARPLVGRVRVGATFPDGQSKTFHEGELADAAADLGAFTGYFLSALTGPFGAMTGVVRAATLAGASASEAEGRLFHLDELKKALPRDSSALVLIATPEMCDATEELFKPYEPRVVRRQVADELRQRLQAVHDRLVQQFAEAERAEREERPASH